MGEGVDILWLGGIAPERLRALASIRMIAAQGVDVRLLPLPLAETITCYYQTLTGMGSGKLGRFDAVRPVAYEPQEEAEVPEGAWRRELPDLLSAGGRAATLLETDIEHALSTGERESADCLITRLRYAGSADDAALDALVSQHAASMGAAGHMLVLTDVWSPPPRRLVNVNTFLANMGLLEARSGAHPGSEIVWSETLAYGLGTGQVWLNMRGREPAGTVKPGREYDDVRSTLIDLLCDEWRDPETGEPVVAQVLTREDAYTGEHLFRAPDLIVVYRPGYAASPRAAALDLDEASVQPGSQDSPIPAEEPGACLIGRGPALATGAEASGRLIDIAPSVLYLLGAPIPQHLDGHVMTEMFSSAYRERTPVVWTENDATALSGEEEDVIKGRLQALGYLG